MQKIRFTKSGFEKVKKEYEDFLIQRKPAVEELSKARAMGDLSENGYYKGARAKLSHIDWSLRRLKNDIQNAIIIDSAKSEFVSIGSVVTLSNGKKYEVVGDLEANPKEGKISLLSPIGKALKDKREDDQVFMETPSGKMSLTITKLS